MDDYLEQSSPDPSDRFAAADGSSFESRCFIEMVEKQSNTVCDFIESL